MTDLTGKTQAVLSPSTVKRFLEANKLPYKEGHYAALPLTCPLCERETSQRLHRQYIRPGDWCALRARSTVSWAALVDQVKLSGNVVVMYERVLCETVNWYSEQCDCS